MGRQGVLNRTLLLIKVRVGYLIEFPTTVTSQGCSDGAVTGLLTWAVLFICVRFGLEHVWQDGGCVEGEGPK